MAHLPAWRRTLARKVLRQRSSSIAEIAERVGYDSAHAQSRVHPLKRGRGTAASC